MTQKLDLVIKNALIIDGTGAVGWHGDVGIRGDRIEKVDTRISEGGYIELDARGHALTPGFIDAHTHDDGVILAQPAHPAKITQGVTTIVIGNCGISLAPLVEFKELPSVLGLFKPYYKGFYESFNEYFDAVKEVMPAVNVVAQVGHTSLRYMCMEDLNKPATKDEQAKMAQMLTESLEQGAAGFSSGLEYAPANNSSEEELTMLAKIVHHYGGFYTSHMRDEGEGVLNSIKETAAVGRNARVPVVISHHKLAGIANHGRSQETLNAIEQARRSQIVNFDVYPYTASSTVLDEKRVRRASKTLIAFSANYPYFSGREFTAIQDEWGLSIEETIARLSPAVGIYFNMNEDDVSNILAHPAAMIGSDGIPDDNHPHPRLWGTFPRVLGHYVRERKLLTLENAVYKMTGLPAQNFGIHNRGIIQEGYFADLVMFDPETIIDKATFENPKTPAGGIDGVWVNGIMTYARNGQTRLRAGRALKRNDLRRLNWH